MFKTKKESDEVRADIVKSLSFQIFDQCSEWWRIHTLLAEKVKADNEITTLLKKSIDEIVAEMAPLKDSKNKEDKKKRTELGAELDEKTLAISSFAAKYSKYHAQMEAIGKEIEFNKIRHAFLTNWEFKDIPEKIADEKNNNSQKEVGATVAAGESK